MILGFLEIGPHWAGPRTHKMSTNPTTIARTDLTSDCKSTAENVDMCGANERHATEGLHLISHFDRGTRVLCRPHAKDFLGVSS